MSSYTGFQIEQRKNGDKTFLKYNKFKDEKTQKEFFMKKKSKGKKQSKGMTGKSLNKSEWDILHFEQDGEKKSSKKDKAPYKKHTVKSLIDEVKGMDVIKGGKPSLKAKKPSKKAKKPSKKAKKPSKKAKKPSKKAKKPSKKAKKPSKKAKKPSKKPSRKPSRKTKKPSKKASRS